MAEHALTELRSQRQADRRELKASLVCMASARPARAIQ